MVKSERIPEPIFFKSHSPRIDLRIIEALRLEKNTGDTTNLVSLEWFVTAIFKVSAPAENICTISKSSSSTCSQGEIKVISTPSLVRNSAVLKAWVLTPPLTAEILKGATKATFIICSYFSNHK